MSHEEALLAHVRWMANLVHQAYHHDHPGRWSQECKKDICASTAHVLRELGIEPDPATVRQ